MYLSNELKERKQQEAKGNNFAVMGERRKKCGAKSEKGLATKKNFEIDVMKMLNLFSPYGTSKRLFFFSRQQQEKWNLNDKLRYHISQFSLSVRWQKNIYYNNKTLLSVFLSSLPPFTTFSLSLVCCSKWRK
jgi:hypothetical protein